MDAAGTGASVAVVVVAVNLGLLVLLLLLAIVVAVLTVISLRVVRQLGLGLVGSVVPATVIGSRLVLYLDQGFVDDLHLADKRLKEDGTFRVLGHDESKRDGDTNADLTSATEQVRQGQKKHLKISVAIRIGLSLEHTRGVRVCTWSRAHGPGAPDRCNSRVPWAYWVTAFVPHFGKRRHGKDAGGMIVLVNTGRSQCPLKQGTLYAGPITGKWYEQDGKPRWWC